MLAAVLTAAWCRTGHQVLVIAIPSDKADAYMDFTKLKTSDWVIAGSGLVLLIASFLDWFTAEIEGNEFFSGASAGGNGWDVGFFWAGIPVIIGLAMIAVVAIRAFSPDTKLPDLPIGWGQTLFIAGVVAAVIVVLKLLIGEDVDAPEGLGVDVEVSRSIGLYLATLASIGLAVGGFLKWQDDKAGAGSLPGGSPAPGSPPPPPPGGSSF
jgi:hypothetical protein